MNADGIARFYRWIEYAAFGRTLESARFDFLSQAAEAESVLILGEGDGRFLRAFFRCNRRASVDAVEGSANMIALARKRLPECAQSRVRFHQLDVTRDALPSGPFDTAVALFFFDVLTASDAAALVANIGPNMRAGALWLVTEFQEPSGRFARLHARVWLFTMYRFFALTTRLRVSAIPPYREILERAGFTEIQHKERRFGLIRSQVWRKEDPKP